MILITGGAGFIGSHIADILIQNNYKVIIADNLSTGKKDNINNKAIFYNIDIKNYNDLENIFNNNKIEYIIHLAAQVSVPNSIRNPINDANENIIATLNIIELSKKYNIKKIIASSSAAVYGIPKKLPIDELHTTIPISYYGLSKLTMEKYLILSNLNYIICRFSNVYGPRQTPHGEAGVVSIFMDNAINNKDLNIFGDGKQTRDFIYVEDIAKIFLFFIEKNISNEILNISTNNSININELANTIINISKSNIKINYLEKRDGDIDDSILDNKKLLNLININFTTIDEGLKKLLKTLI
ncbi:NAD-dependent epimerase/dehydratase family protein [Brachyspira pilosicoli]|uniref:NAD-dependent epimerase/dehydratase family protein n=1 Tax=Brachyspira pilosicoli TaxID=52584 RepID=A0AAJ6KCT1_BRAPL|nr:NAD-dependent epimerase/dehydratase family protein [Brachyspira pilosicoli]WIH89215.1 NAD-dependent epimerase/dehydratase family protein [Brachyspira pilosicoli]WIH91510.1 NAD-dependent epimerase/dehydratase family protein [Brachyspira pilosicoli]WIH93799.1 NAD-dependent epimerase/dehydratase family protein [Brachyspira pilosicoli]